MMWVEMKQSVYTLTLDYCNIRGKSNANNFLRYGCWQTCSSVQLDEENTIKPISTS